MPKNGIIMTYYSSARCFTREHEYSHKLSPKLGKIYEWLERYFSLI